MGKAGFIVLYQTYTMAPYLHKHIINRQFKLAIFIVTILTPGKGVRYLERRARNKRGVLAVSRISRIHSWMERNLERPFFEAEMARAIPSEKKGGVSTAVYLISAGGVVLTVSWLFLSLV